MSFGWSAGDIALAIQLLYKVGTALKEAGGASSAYQEATSFLDSLEATLEHLRLLSSTTIDAAKAVEIRSQVSQLRRPVTRFLEDVKKYEASLAAASSRGKIASAPRRIQFALEVPGKLKKLQDEITVPMLTLSMFISFNLLHVS